MLLFTVCLRKCVPRDTLWWSMAISIKAAIIFIILYYFARVVRAITYMYSLIIAYMCSPECSRQYAPKPHQDAQRYLTNQN